MTVVSRVVMGLSPRRRFKVPLDADTGAAATLHVSDWTTEVAVEVGP